MPFKYRRGLDITTESLDVFRQHTSLAVLPALSLLAVGSAFAVLAAGVHCASRVFDGEQTSV